MNDKLELHDIYMSFVNELNNTKEIYAKLTGDPVPMDNAIKSMSAMINMLHNMECPVCKILNHTGTLKFRYELNGYKCDTCVAFGTREYFERGRVLR